MVTACSPMYELIISTIETCRSTHIQLLQRLLDTPGTSAREHMQQEVVKCQRAARCITLEKGGKYMLLTDAMLSDHRNARRETADQLESFSAFAPLKRVTSCSCSWVPFLVSGS